MLASARRRSNRLRSDPVGRPARTPRWHDGYAIDEQVDHDFGQGGNGVVVTGPDGSIAFGLADASAADYASGRAAVVFLPGVGLPGHAPTAREDGC